jgi:preprotein translocase subunit SecD
MRMYSRWQTAAILGVAAFFCLAAVPNVLPARAYAALPTWAQRTVPLGIDLQGGSYIQFEVDRPLAHRLLSEELRDDVRKVLRDERVGYTGLVARGDVVEVRVREASDLLRAFARLRELAEPFELAASSPKVPVAVPAGTPSVRSTPGVTRSGPLLELTVDGQVIRLARPRVVIDAWITRARDHRALVMNQRLSAANAPGSSVRRVGADRIVLEVPGLSDPRPLIYHLLY